MTTASLTSATSTRQARFPKVEFLKDEKTGSVIVKINKELMKKRPGLRLFANALIKAELSGDINHVINCLLN
jgi:hypothetical protein